MQVAHLPNGDIIASASKSPAIASPTKSGSSLAVPVPVVARAKIWVITANDKCAASQALRIPRMRSTPILKASELKKCSGGGSGPAIFLDSGDGKLEDFWDSADAFQARVREIADKTKRTVDDVFEDTAKLLRDRHDSDKKSYQTRMAAWRARVEPCVRERLRDQVVTLANNQSFNVQIPFSSEFGPLVATMRCIVGDASQTPLPVFQVTSATTIDFTGY